MGLLTIIKRQKVKDREIRVLVLGLDNSGKTTIIKQVMGEDVDSVSPTMGFNINSISFRGYLLNVWDIGGQTSLRSFWSNYFDKTNTVVWVIDSASLERLEESYEELRSKVILRDRLVGVSLLIVINKVDLVEKGERAVIRDRVISELNLDKIHKDKWSIELVSARTGEGLDTILNWIVSREF